MNTLVIYDNYTGNDVIAETNNFTGGKFFYVDIGYDSNTDYLEIGLIVVATMPTLLGSLPKIVYVSDVDILDSDRAYHLPSEFSESGYSCKIYFYCSEPIHLKIYLVTSNVTQESISQQINELKEQNTSNQEQLDTIIDIIRAINLDPTLLLSSIDSSNNLDNIAGSNNVYPLLFS